ncbi:MAG: hypothetical protein CVU56_20160 [Deltaproteobacteria bacterium HGW-Deltaproteobacteria-14]|jgi:NAD(P)H-dependent FMN reductase|nr:MAG: hypothetical protein CVU56_20160 [Deltaproteobacteria bacterium HGW-Deltaproteobacteria-14]
MLRILAISGSLRRGSSNTAVLRAAARLAPDGVAVRLWEGPRGLPLFEPDAPVGPPLVTALRERLASADGLIIASPEYMHAMTGALKTALEWVTASGELMDLPTAALNTSSRAHLAYESLLDTLTTMDARLVSEGCLRIPLVSNAVTVDDVVATEAFAAPIRESVAALVAEIRRRPRARDVAAPPLAAAPALADGRAKVASRAQARLYGEPVTALPAELLAVLPHDKHDTAGLARWSELSERERYCLVPYLLVWLQDYNWPVAKRVHDLLVPLGPDLVPFVRAVLEGDDAVWSYWLLAELVPALPPAALRLMRPQLARLAAAPSDEEVDLVAAEALALAAPERPR